MNGIKKVVFSAVAAATVFLSGVAYAAERPAPHISVDPLFDAPVDARQEVMGGINYFGWSMYDNLKDQESGNIFYSPYSIYEALAMTYTGAEGETAEQMRQLLARRVENADAVSSALKELRGELHSRGLTRIGSAKTFEFNIANTLWGQQGYDFRPEWMQSLKKSFGAGLMTVDFKKSAEAARKKINEWVENKTNNRIKDLLEPGAVDDSTRLVLTNAIYFKASWTEPFQEGLTQKKDFTRTDGSKVKVNMMRSVDKFHYYEEADLQVAAIPYGKGDMSMVIMLPAPGKLAEAEAWLTNGGHGIAPGFTSDNSGKRKLDLQVPRFEMNTGFNLKQLLMDMGMVLPFTDAADFSGMSKSGGLMIDDVIHKAFVKVDEEGTEAAAATAVKMVATMAPVPEEPLPFICDRPFLFAVRDNKTGTILFMGRVSDPS